MADLATFRDGIKAISPSWLQRGTAEKILFSLGVQIDALIDGVVAGVKSRFPGVYSGESLPYLGRDRKIRRGRAEADEVYAVRLARWLDDHRRRGGPHALLEQVRAHYAAAPFAADVVYYSGRRFQMDLAGDIATRDAITWAPDTDSARWARWWLFYLEWPDAVATDGLWGDPGTWGDGFVWSSDLTAGEVEDLRLLPREWNTGHAFGTLVLLPTGAELWGYPVGAWGDAGTWGASAPIKLGVGTYG